MMNMGDSEQKQPKQEKDIQSNRIENILATLTSCKNDFITEKEESKKLREKNLKLEVELKETRELEKSHRYHLLSSREMIGNLQETVSQLVHVKRDMKKLKDEIISKDCTISMMEKDKENIISQHNAAVLELRNSNEKHIEELTVINERKIQQVQHECDTQIAQFSCVIEELRSKIKDMEANHIDKMNVVVLKYEEKIQRAAAQVSQLQEQLAHQAAKTDSNIDAYKRRLEDLEEKLKQSQFKQYLAAGSYRSQYESQVERPYSAAEESYPGGYTGVASTGSRSTGEDLDPVLARPIPKTPQIEVPNFKVPKQSTLQVMYYDTTPKNKKGQFNITKKRKLYNDKDFQDF